jgi:hypothetical protein
MRRLLSAMRDRQARLARTSCLAALALTAVGCGSRKPAAPDFGPLPGSEPQQVAPVALTYTVPLTVQSRFREDLTLYVLHDGISSRLTRVGSSSTTRVIIPKNMVGTSGEMVLLLEPVGSRSGVADRYQSQRVRVLPGQGLVWTLETQLTRSFLQVVPAAAISADSTKP